MPRVPSARYSVHRSLRAKANGLGRALAAKGHAGALRRNLRDRRETKEAVLSAHTSLVRDTPRLATTPWASTSGNRPAVEFLDARPR